MTGPLTVKELELLLEIVGLHRRKIRSLLDRMIYVESITHYESQLKDVQVVIAKRETRYRAAAKNVCNGEGAMTAKLG
jgi:hypothetical protein